MLDASVSDGELEPGKWLVFVELDRRSKVPNRIITLLSDLETLTELELKDWNVDIEGDTYDADEDTIREHMVLNPNEYEMEKGTEENEQFPGESHETWETNGSHGSKTEGEAEFRSRAGNSAEFREIQSARALADFTTEGKENGDGETVTQEHQGRTREADLIKSRKPKENVAHVHHAGVAEHEIQLALGDRDIPHIEDIAGE